MSCIFPLSLLTGVFVLLFVRYLLHSLSGTSTCFEVSVPIFIKIFFIFLREEFLITFILILLSRLIFIVISLYVKVFLVQRFMLLTSFIK